MVWWIYGIVVVTRLKIVILFVKKRLNNLLEYLRLIRGLYQAGRWWWPDEIMMTCGGLPLSHVIHNSQYRARNMDSWSYRLISHSRREDLILVDSWQWFHELSHNTSHRTENSFLHRKCECRQIITILRALVLDCWTQYFKSQNLPLWPGIGELDIFPV